MTSRELLGRAALMTAATVWGAGVSLRQDVPGEPLTLRVPGPVPLHLAVGLGSGLSAPWPMPAAVLVAVLAPRAGAARAARTCAVVGGMFLAGVLVEPVTWGRRRRSPAVASTVVLNVVSAVALLSAPWAVRRRAASPPLSSARPGWARQRASRSGGVAVRRRGGPEAWRQKA